MTRAAIIDAAIELVLAQGRDHVTVEQIADRAQVSRRTFFNYFPGIDAALNAPTEDLLAHALSQIESMPAEESVVDEVMRVFLTNVTSSYLQQCLELGQELDKHAEFLRYELVVWDKAERDFVTALQQRVSETMPRLRLTTFVASVLGSSRATMNEWLRTLDHEVTAADLDNLKALLLETVGIVRDGFADL